MAKREKIITAGRMVYAACYTIPAYRMDETPRQRGEKRHATRTWAAKINRYKSYEKLEQLIYCNFAAGDKYVTFTYDEANLVSSREELMADFKWWRRKLCLLRSPRGQGIKYIYIPEHRHGDARWHAHAIINGCGPGDLEEFQRCWTKGRVDVEWFDYSLLEDLRGYLTKEAPDKVGQHLWITSRGLLRPQIASGIRSNDYQMTLPPGVVCKEQESRQNEYGDFQYLKYFIPD